MSDQINMSICILCDIVSIELCTCTVQMSYTPYCPTGPYASLNLFSVQFPLLLEPLPHREDQVLVVVAVVEPLLEHPLFCGQSSHA